MLQKHKNEQTMSILKRLKQKGPPASKRLDMSMTLPPEEQEGELLEDPELGMPDASGIVTDLSMPTAMPIGNTRPTSSAKKKKPRSR
jgi:hypothetical protein